MTENQRREEFEKLGISKKIYQNIMIHIRLLNK